MEINPTQKNNFNVMQEPQMADELIVPEAEYEQLLALVKKEHSMFVARAKYYVPKMADALERAGMTPEQIRQKIYADLRKVWTHGTIVNALPSRFKDHMKADNAKKRAAKSEPLLTQNEQKQAVQIEDANSNPKHKQPKKEQVFCDMVSVTLHKDGKIIQTASFRKDSTGRSVVVENCDARLSIFYRERDFTLSQVVT